MANFDKKWSQLSGDESRAMKEKYGSREAWQKAKSKAQSHQTGNAGSTPNGQALNNEHSPKANDVGAAAKPAATSKYGKNTNWNKLTKSGSVSDEVRNDPRLQEMVKDPHTGEMKNKYAIKYSSGGIIKNPNVHNMQAVQRVQKKEAQRAAERAPSFNEIQRQEKSQEADAYRQSRVDLQLHKDAVGRRGVYEYQSARDLQNSKGPIYYDDTGDLTDTQKERNALIRTFRDSGYDYNHADVLRHMKGGKENKMFTGLYDDYGGYQNWYDNHSIYSGENAQQAGHVHDASLRLEGDNFDADYNLNLGNWTGSKDIMDRDEVLRQGNARQEAGKNYYNSDSFKQKYGQYDWAQNDMFNANSTFEERYERRGYKR